MEIKIIPITEEDADELVSIQKQAFKRLYELYNDEQNPYLRDQNEILRWIHDPNIYTWKIICNNQLCGAISIRQRENNEFYLGRIFILPDMQGKGIASKALNLCEREFPNARKWSLDFPIDQIANRRCYEKCGYVDTGKVEVINDRLTLAVYEKIISWS